MLFSSISFLYYFLPILLIIYFIVPNKLKNIVLLVASLLFYFYGEPKYIIILLLSCLINYIFGILIGKYKSKKLFMALAVIINIGILFYFKYINFFIQNLNTIFNSNITLFKIIMPIGISFFTFQTLSYVIDVYNNKVKYEKNLLNFSTYVCLFPQLVAGPIVRYVTINDELKNRKYNYESFSNGVKRFVIGLAKKVLIANVIGEMCQVLMAMAAKSVLSHWVSAIGYTLQIYFDFSGYSDMAIGLGLMFGFHFLENFKYPFISSSITEFWRRWHISLSSWLRDYVYIPLGGNRVSKYKWFRNIIIVWFLTGFWHGASWNFIIWGLYFAVLLIGEKKIWGKYLENRLVLKHIYTLFLIIISFVIFNSLNMSDFLLFIKSMFGLNNLPLLNFESLYYLNSYLVIIIIAIIASTPISSKLKQIKFLKYLEPIYYLILLLLVTSFLIDSSFNPFLYFRF